MTSLPEEIGNLTSLTRLGLVDNQLTSLPEEIGKLDLVKACLGEYAEAYKTLRNEYLANN